MSNLSDKELDRLSREAADSYEPDTSSMSWSRLEQKLTQQMPERPPDGFRFGRISPYVWGPAVILLAGASFFFIKNISYSKDSTPTSNSAITTNSSSAAKEKQTDEKTIRIDSAGSATTLTESGKENDGQVNNNDPDASAGLSSVKTEPSRGIQSESQFEKSIAGSKTGGSTASGRNSSAGSTGHSVGGNAKAAGTGAIIVAGTNGSLNSGAQHMNESDTKTQSTLTGTENAADAVDPLTTQREKNTLSLPPIAATGLGLGTVSGNDSLLNKPSLSKKTIKSKSLRLNRSLNFGLSFGPDYTDGGGITNNQIGNNIGITVGYYLTNKLSVNTGIFYSNKFYWAHGHGYNQSQPATGYINTFAASPPIDYLNGSCNMWELPLTLRYDFAHNEKTRFFANAGLSSYFMMKQNYIYFIHTNSQRLAAWKTSNNQQINYWFSVADISLGFETEVGKGVSFQAEPFIRLPLRSMGQENLRLNSYGFLLSFRYTPVLSRTKK